MLYRRVCSTLDSKGTLIPYTDSVYDHLTDLDIDSYSSVYLYNEEQKEQFYKPIVKVKDGNKIETINGAAGIKDVVTNKLVFDFDIDKHKKTTLESVRKDTIEAISRLKKAGFPEDSLQVSFSGNKGFGIVVDLDEFISPNQHKEIAKNLVGDLDSWDTKVYNASRILRVPLTKHQSSKLYKMPITIDELKDSSIKEIKEMASESYDAKEVFEAMEYKSAKLPEFLKKSEKTEKKERKKDYSPTLESEVCNLDFSKKPSWLSHWKYALSEGYFPPGTRSYALMILGATFAAQGLNKKVTYRMLKGAAELQAERFDQDKFESDEIWANITEQVYSPTWNGGTYAEDNFPEELQDYLISLGIPRSTTEEEQDTVLISDGFGDFEEYANNIDKYTMKFGLPKLDEKLKVRKGHLVYVLAPPGVGKTSMAVTILNNTSKMGTNSFFASYDMYKNNVYQKLIQRHTGMDEEALFDVFRKRDKEKIVKFRRMLAKEYENVSFCFKSGQSIEGLKQSIRRQEEKRGCKIDLVVVDYLELIQTKVSDPTAASAEAAQGLREIANEGRVVIGLLQPNKMSSTPDEPLLSYNAAKGSSSIAQSATAIITCHRPGMSSAENNINDHYFGINCVKNRNGSLFSLDFGWKGSTQTIYELDDRQKQDLKSLREGKAARKMAEAGEL